MPTINPSRIETSKRVCWQIPNLFIRKSHPKPPATAKKNSAILIESPSGRPNNNPGTGIIAAPGGRKLQFIELADKSFASGLSKKFGEGT